MGIVIVVLFGVAVIQFARTTVGNPYLGSALGFGLKFLLFLAAVLWIVFLVDRRLKKRQQQ
jgi:hypothetical protein